MPQCKYGNEATRATAKERTIRRHNAKQCICYGNHQPSSNESRNIPKPAKTPNKPNTPTGETLTAKVDVTSDGGEFVDVQTTEKITNWDHIFKKFDLDPEAFVIEGDSVRMSTWQQSKALEDGTRDIVNLYSYRARFARKTEAGINYDQLAEYVRNWTPATVTKGDNPTTYVVSLADWQLGKGEADGTPGTIKRIKASLANIIDDIHGMQKRGSLPRSLLLANMGDHIENVYSSYANQAFTTDLNVREQINLALELNLLWIKTLAPYFEEVTYSACLCNHGQLSRNGGKTNVSDDADNATGLIGDTLKTLCTLHEDLKHVHFEIPHDEMITLVTTNGVKIAMGHGHKISGNEPAWLAKQAQNLAHRRNFHVDIWLLAHKHHASLIDLGPYTRIQATTNDPGSKYFEDMSGMYSRTGTTVFVTGEQLPGKWDHYRIH
ncbi:hypothetical protein [Glutamicibacter arilaitensis]|uniref:Uncharacterized protein n=1 Tax=Glutamicibacter arilaitensis TaxID=256701 RepID=A0A4Y8TYM8_9MICC|nr:hypothetical protein [Glutamicibacter arilaitensis]TFH57296.1 hypothetical protein EXY26_09960 [Glutamicibacter arilaitensis]